MRSANTLLGYRAVVSLSLKLSGGWCDTTIVRVRCLRCCKPHQCLPTDSYTEYFDFLFTSLKLLQHLSTQCIQAMGTMHAIAIRNFQSHKWTIKFKKYACPWDRRNKLGSMSNTIVQRWDDICRCCDHDIVLMLWPRFVRIVTSVTWRCVVMTMMFCWGHDLFPWYWHCVDVVTMTFCWYCD